MSTPENSTLPAERRNVTGTCLVCGGTELAVGPVLAGLPVDTCNIYRSREQAQRAVRGDVNLAMCLSCAHVFNASYNDEVVDYESNYENSQMFSPSFRDFAQSLATRLVAKYELTGKSVIEIGGGRGDFLRLLKAAGVSTAISFGPSYRPDPADDIPRGLSFIQDYYGEKYAHVQADLILCRHVLEHFGEPKPFLDSVRKAVEGQNRPAVYFEVPNGRYVTHDKSGIWDVIYQHVSYFAPRSLTRIFDEVGFTVERNSVDFGGQLLGIEASVGSARGGVEEDDTPLTPAEFARFGRETIEDARRMMDSLTAANKRLAIWGAGAKAVTFLNTLEASSVLCAVDVNPRKWGFFMPGTAQEVIPPSNLPDYNVDAIIVANAIYRDEIATIATALAPRAEVIAL